MYFSNETFKVNYYNFIFQPPLPPPTWFNIFEADKMDVICPQYALPHIVTENMTVSENCLVANIFVPDTVEKNLPVLIYVHGGAFQLGYGNMYTYKALLLQSNKKFILINFYYRLGIHGFLCLGTEEVPGNAGMKDQVALLRWVRKNIASFGGNPYDVTIAGYSAGSASVDLLMLSPAAKGLFNKVIPESGANMATFSVQVDPVKNARDFAKTFNFTDVDNIYALEEFYRTASFDILASDPFFEQKDSTFVFVPCVERKNVEETFLEECPYNILRTGRYDKVPLLHGFANMEGIARVISFDKWRHGMNEKFSNFLPADLQFDSAEEKEEVAKEIKEFYFGNKMVDEESILQYIDYFTDVLFANGHLRALKLHVAANHDKIYLYEYSFVDEEESTIPYTDSVRGAAHCAQTAAIVDGLAFSNKPENNASDDNKKMKSLMRELWSNFITTG